MNRTSRLLIKAGDTQQARVAIAAVLGALAWGLFLVVLGRCLHAKPAPERKPEQPLEMSLVAIPDPAPTLPVATTRSSQMTAEPRQVSALKQPSVQRAHGETRPVRTLTPAPQSQPIARAPEPDRAVAVQPENRSPAQPATAEAPLSPSDHGATTPERVSAGSTSGNSPAHAIMQPLPSVPDDLREQAYQTVAIARFVIHIDGSVAVELIKPTRYPRLNQILVETLRSWRFFPAIQGGSPVETQQDIRVHFNVS